jgi:hypothetical protein
VSIGAFDDSLQHFVCCSLWELQAQLPLSHS